VNPVDGSPIDHRYTHLLGTPVSEWIDVKLLADEEGISIRGLVQQYRLFRHGERHRLKPGPIEVVFSAAELRLRPEIEQLRARNSLLEERVASLERRQI